MKPYPSIASSVGQGFREFPAYVFDKLDGSNLRFEWTRKRGWDKFGTRTRLFDETDSDFGCAIPLFRETWEADLTKIARDNRWDHVIVFMEFYGPNSFAGLHEKADPKTLTLFDVCPNKKGILGPAEYLDLFGSLKIAPLLCMRKWTRGFVDEIRAGKDPSDGPRKMTFEGVVGKGGSGHKLVMAKAKTQAWVDKVKSRFSFDDAKRILES
jgi:hypothetical protein